MNPENIISALKFFNDKKSITILRRSANLFLCGIITSFLFERIYFKYHLLDISDYKGIFEFFSKGKFVVPTLLYLLVWTSTKYIFTYYNLFRRRRYVNKWQFGESEKKIQNAIASWMKDKNSVKKTLTELKEKSKMNYKDIGHVKRVCLKKQNVLEEYLILIIRSAIIISLVFFSTPYFGWKLFGLSVICLVIIFILMMILDFILECLPSVIETVAKAYDSSMENHDNLNPDLK